MRCDLEQILKGIEGKMQVNEVMYLNKPESLYIVKTKQRSICL